MRRKGNSKGNGPLFTSFSLFLAIVELSTSLAAAAADPSPSPGPLEDTGLPATSGAAEAFENLNEIDIPPATPSREKQRKELSRIPKKPSAPPILERPNPGDIFTCERFYSYQGRKLVCDSYVRQDAEKLRPVIMDVPEAVKELDRYQTNRRKIRYTAFAGTFGILLLGFGNFFVKEGNRKRVIMLGGVGVLGGSFLYSFTLLRANEAHLGNAVQYYNNANPESPIELQFTTGFRF